MFGRRGNKVASCTHTHARTHKFHGTTAPTTPMGTRCTRASTLGAVGATESYSLSMASACQRMQMAVSGRSDVMLTPTGLPASRQSIRDSSGVCASMRSANLTRIFLRSAGAVAAHAGNAARAALTAADVS